MGLRKGYTTKELNKIAKGPMPASKGVLVDPRAQLVRLKRAKPQVNIKFPKNGVI